MKRIKRANKSTDVIGYFNPADYPIVIHIPAYQFKVELRPKEFLKDAHGKNLNDPLFECFCHPKGLAKQVSDCLIPINPLPIQGRLE